MQQVVRIQLIPMENEEIQFNDIYKVLRELQYECRQIANRAVQRCWEYSGLQSEYKKTVGHYLDADDNIEILGSRSIDSYIYSDIVKEFTKLQTGCVSQILRDVCGKFKKDQKDYFCGNKSIASYKKNIPIDIHKSSIKLNHDPGTNKWSISLGVLSSAYKKELGLSGRLSFKMVVKDRSTRAILERCYDDVYHITASKLIYNDKTRKWFLNLGFSFEKKLPADGFEENLVMGVFIGVFNAVACSFNNSQETLLLDGGEVEPFRKKMEARRVQLLKQSRNCSCGSGRIGHGYYTRVKPAEHVGTIISNFRDTINHRYSKLIVEFAKKNHCGIIQMEDLSGVTKDDKFLKNWSYYDLQQKIIYKAASYGIVVKKIKTEHLKERCSKCGEIVDKVDSPRFACSSCDSHGKTDYNASQNLAQLDIDILIEESIKVNGAKVQAA